MISQIKITLRSICLLFIALFTVLIVSQQAVMAMQKPGEVPCKVANYAVSLSITSDGVVSYGTLPIGGTTDTVILGDTQIVKNVSDSETVNFKIKGSDAVGGTANWTLAETPGTDEFVHSFSKNHGGEWTALTKYYQSLTTEGVPVNGSQTFDLKIDMPVSVTDYASHTITVTIEAVASGG
jgi:hypothetical protein